MSELVSLPPEFRVKSAAYQTEKSLETGNEGALYRVSFENSQGTMPVLIVGEELAEAKNVAVCFLGTAVPSLEIDGAIYSYYLPGVDYLCRQPGWSAVLLLNWRDYGIGLLRAETAFPGIPPYSLEEKRGVASSLARWVCQEARSAQRLGVIGHSTPGGDLCQHYQGFLSMDDRLWVVAESPSGIGADASSIRTYGKLAGFSDGRILKGIMTSQRRLPEGLRNKLLADNYGLREIGPWEKGITDATPPEVAIKELLAEKGRKVVVTPNPRFRVTIGSQDKMVDPKALEGLLGETSLHVFPGAGHLVLRDHKMAEEWAKYILARTN